MAPSALIFIADGTEEMEFTIAYDTLVRGGVECTSALVGVTRIDSVAICSRGVKIIADTTLESRDVADKSFDLIVVPGGAEGAKTISKNAKVQEMIRSQINVGRFVGMICAGSLAALEAKLPSQPVTSHPSVKDSLKDSFEYREDSVVVSGKLVTSRGPGTAFPFALKLVELLCGEAKMREVHAPMIFPGSG
ncbi:DJ-1 [Auricularia subglabra TFB-10046 SS5]|nr:DJ-1 [Auricularia subglabra TFB-10046 SS5]